MANLCPSHFSVVWKWKHFYFASWLWGWHQNVLTFVVIVDRQVLAKALKENRTLKRLNLARNDIGLQGVQARRSDWGSGRTARLKQPLGAKIAHCCWELDNSCCWIYVEWCWILWIWFLMPGFTDNSTCVLCRFLIHPLFWSKCWCAFLQLLLLCNSYQFMCSCVASPPRVVAWFVEVWHRSLRAVELTAWVSYLVRLKSMYQTESLKAPTPWPNEIGGGSQVFRHVTQEMWTATRRFSKL